MNARLAYVLLALPLAACGGGKAATTGPTTPGNTGGADAPAMSYASMFEQGKTWKLAVENHSSYYDDQDPKADANGNVSSTVQGTGRCTVTSVSTIEAGQLAEIECAFELPDGSSSGGDPLTGVWISTSTGLYHLDSVPEPGTTPALDQDHLVLPQPVAASTREVFDKEYDPDNPVGRVELTQKGATWCHMTSWMQGDEAWSGVCFGPDGPASGEFGWAGGSEHSTTFTVVP